MPSSTRSTDRSSGLTLSTSSATSAAVHGESSTVLVSVVRGNDTGGDAGGPGSLSGDPQVILSRLSASPSKRGTLLFDPSA